MGNNICIYTCDVKIKTKNPETRKWNRESRCCTYTRAGARACLCDDHDDDVERRNRGEAGGGRTFPASASTSISASASNLCSLSLSLSSLSPFAVPGTIFSAVNDGVFFPLSVGRRNPTPFLRSWCRRRHDPSSAGKTHIYTQTKENIRCSPSHCLAMRTR